MSRSVWMLLILAVFTACDLPIASGSCLGPQPFTIGSSANGVAFKDDCSGPTDIDGDVYAFSLASHTGFRVEMAPEGFRGSIGLYQGVYGVTPSPRMISETIGTGSATVGAREFLPPGDYFIMAGPAEREGGDYVLSTAIEGMVNCAYFSWSIPGADITGLVNNSDCAGNSPAFQDVYEVWLPAGATLKAVVQGDKPGTLLIRSGSAASADLMSKNTAANVADSLSYLVPTAGGYRVHVLATPTLTGPMSYSLKIR